MKDEGRVAFRARHLQIVPPRADKCGLSSTNPKRNAPISRLALRYNTSKYVRLILKCPS